jgi:hypothetical protein
MAQLIGTASNQVPTNGDLGSAAFMDSSAFYSTGVTSSFRNIVINGAMEVAQRATSVTGLQSGNSNYYVIDRFGIQNGGSGTFRITYDQSTDAAPGFSKSAKLTVTTPLTGGTSPTSYCGWYYVVEGYDCARLGWGSTNAKPLTISFWVKSSVAGRYAHVGLRVDTAANGTYSCFTNIDINTANTWEYKTVTIPALPSGISLASTTNGAGIQIHINTFAGVGSVGTPTNLVWANINALGTNAYVNDTRWIGTNGATFQITGVQAEVGTQATPFEYRPLAIEQLLCYRYHYREVAGTFDYTSFLNGSGAFAYLYVTGRFPVPMRTAPSVTFSTDSTGGSGYLVPIASCAVTSGSDVNGGLTTSGTPGALVVSNSAIGRAQYVSPPAITRGQTYKNARDGSVVADAEL